MAQGRLDKEWVELILQARKLGIKMEVLQAFFSDKRKEADQTRKAYIL